jgi:cobalt/nickel transport system permease protein
MDLNFFKTLSNANTPLHRLDGRVKTVFFLASIIASAMVTHWYLAGVSWLVGLVIFSTLRLPWRLLTLRLAIPFGIAWLVLLSLLFTNGNHPLWIVFRKPFVLVIYSEGLSLGLLMMLRIMATVTMASLLSFSTPMTEILATLRICKVPGVMVDIAEMMFRYAFIMNDVAINMHYAQICRTVSKISWIERTRNVGHVAAHVILKSVDRSIKIYNAMLARGYSEGSVSLNYFTMSISPSDLCHGLLLMVLPLALLAINLVI